MTPSALLFDLDGTLLDSDPLHREVFVDLLTPCGFDVDAEFYQTRIHGRLNVDVFTELMPDEDARRMDRVKEAMFRDLLATRSVLPAAGLVRLLDRADAAGLRYGVATNAPRENAEAMLRAIGLRARIEVVVTVDDCARGKPAPDPFLLAARQLDAAPGDALAFEDSPSGLTAARAAGCTVIGLPTTLSPDALRRAGAHHVIRDFNDSALEPLLGLPTGATP